MILENLDWNDVWMVRTQKHLECGNKTECSSIWGEKEAARKFWEMSQRDGQKRARKTLASLNLTPDSRVLDIGAGAGSLAIPISKQVAHVTAVEPSTGMLEVLQENIVEYGCDNISCIKKRWEDIDVEKDLDGPYDIIIASFSLGMPDIRKAIEDMQAVSSGYIYLYWFAGETSWNIHSKKIWPKMHGKEYCSMPKCDLLYNVLYDMGIYPDMSTFKLGRIERYASIAEAVDNLSTHFSVSTDKHKDILGEYLEGCLEKDGDEYLYDASSTRVKIWWKT
ncbi:class I SAM-dependent methyltransferase [Methanolobus sp. ZRKC3]|uniref:class I SAM-dependent methyltransferase n=1 Tax=Methanolobus sp. ZRKC3 TaxID=3125786 RepID=UPI0032474A04